MKTGKTDRRLAAILVADIAGYSRLMAQDEAGTLEAVRALKEHVLDPSMRTHGGRLFKTMGDGFLAEFTSAVSAVSCALAVQSQLDATGSAVRLRIGINVGDVAVDGDDLLGDGVNVAARIEAAAPVGGIAISGVTHDSITGKIAATFRPAGRTSLKNIDRNVPVWLWHPDAAGQVSGASVRASIDPRPSIVVLPFDALSADPAHDVIALGFVEAITAVLSRIRSFFVIARNTAYAYRGRAVPVPQIGRELGVSYALEGSVQIAGPRIRVTVQLIETENGNHIWAERYDGRIEEMFDLQDLITAKVAGALQPSIRTAEIEKKAPAQATAGPRRLRLYDAGTATCLDAGRRRSAGRAGSAGQRPLPRSRLSFRFGAGGVVPCAAIRLQLDRRS